jgi:hypothetical protein
MDDEERWMDMALDYLRVDIGLLKYFQLILISSLMDLDLSHIARLI